MICLYGSKGYIGSAFAKELTARELEWVAMDYRKEMLFSYETEFVINAAGFVVRPSVDLCEDHKCETLMGNTVFPTQLAAVCEEAGIPLLHISTGCMFNGDNEGKGWNENAIPQLTFDTGSGFYVGSKHLGELAVSKYDLAYICRIRIPFDNHDHPGNYLTKMMTYEKLYNDTNSLTHRGDFVSACLDLVKSEAPYGLYNMTNPGSVATTDVTDAIARLLKPGWVPKWWGHEEFHSKVARTLKSNCVLNTDKLAKAGVVMRPVRVAIESSLREWTT